VVHPVGGSASDKRSTVLLRLVSGRRRGKKGGKSLCSRGGKGEEKPFFERTSAGAGVPRPDAQKKKGKKKAGGPVAGKKKKKKKTSGGVRGVGRSSHACRRKGGREKKGKRVRRLMSGKGGRKRGRMATWCGTLPRRPLLLGQGEGGGGEKRKKTEMMFALSREKREKKKKKKTRVQPQMEQKRYCPFAGKPFNSQKEKKKTFALAPEKKKKKKKKGKFRDAALRWGAVGRVLLLFVREKRGGEKKKREGRKYNISGGKKKKHSNPI